MATMFDRVEKPKAGDMPPQQWFCIRRDGKPDLCVQGHVIGTTRKGALGIYRLKPVEDEQGNIGFQQIIVHLFNQWSDCEVVEVPEEGTKH